MNKEIVMDYVDKGGKTHYECSQLFCMSRLRHVRHVNVWFNIIGGPSGLLQDVLDIGMQTTDNITSKTQI